MPCKWTTGIGFKRTKQIMGPTTSFHIIFTYHRRWYAGEVYVAGGPGF